MFRQGQTDPASRELKRVIDDNIEFCKRHSRDYEIVEWLVEKAALGRVTGDVDVASAAVLEARKMRDNADVGLSFAANREFELEARRVAARFGPVSRQTRATLERAEDALDRSGHELLRCDVLLLRAALFGEKKR